MSTAQDTLPLDGSVVKRSVAPPATDKMRDLTRIVRHALKAAVATGPLDRAIRSAAWQDGPLSDADDLEDRARQLAHQLNELLAQRADPHRETVHA